MRFTKPLTATAIVLALAAPAAAFTAQATTDLNLRAGPGSIYPIEGVINTSESVDVEGCIAGSEWCKVTHNGQQGWAYAAYLSTVYQNNPVVVYDNVQALNVPEVTYVPVAGVNAHTVKTTGELVVSAPVVGVVAPAPAVVPEPVTLNYVKANPVQPVYLNGEVVVGAGIPQEVDLYPVPNGPYSYVNVNDQIVLVEPEKRTIIQVVR